MGFEKLIDPVFTSPQASRLAFSWTLFQAGVISRTQRENDVWSAEELCVEDEYKFIRRNFNKRWSYYVLFLRMICFNNPFSELKAFRSAQNVKRNVRTSLDGLFSDYLDYKSNLLEARPLVTIVIPTLNRYSYLRDVFRDLELQTYRKFEVLVVDQSSPFDLSVYNGWTFRLRYWHQKNRALWNARNSAILSSEADYILLYDDDSRVGRDWIEQHLKAIDYFDADLSSGASISAVGAEIPDHYSYFRWSDQLDTGNVLVKREVFRKIGLFDLQFEGQRMGDGEFGMRAYLAGFRNISNPFAKRIHLKVSQGGLREMGNWDAFRPRNLFAPRPIPSALYYSRRYFGRRRSLLWLLVTVPQSLSSYKFKGRKLFQWTSLSIAILALPFVLISVCKSWIISSKMIRSGPKIPTLN